MPGKFTRAASSTPTIPGGFHTSSKKTQQQADQRRLRAQNRGAKLQQVDDARKRNDKKREVRKTFVPAYTFKHVYIGNLQFRITQEKLEEHFKDCGNIRATIIRVSRGAALTCGMNVPAVAQSPRDRQYASMEFYDTASALRALKYHKSVLEGCELVVSPSAADLPEVADLIRPHLEKMRLRQETTRPMPPPRFNSKPLVRNDTERDFTDPQRDRNRFWGVSFAKGIA